MDIPPRVRPMFTAAGWQPGRCVLVHDQVPQLHPAHDVVSMLVGPNLAASNSPVPTLSFAFATLMQTTSYRPGTRCFEASLSAWPKFRTAMVSCSSTRLDGASARAKSTTPFTSRGKRLARLWSDCCLGSKPDPCCGPIRTKLAYTARHSLADTQRFLTIIREVR